MPEKIEVQTSELIGPALDWAVAHATKAWEWAHEWFPTMTLDPTFLGVSDNAPGGHVSLVPRNPMRQESQSFKPSTDWAQGGRLIEQYGICLDFRPASKCWDAHRTSWINRCETPLIAACRAIVASVLGDTVQIPAELAQPIKAA